MDMRPPTDEELDTLTHGTMTSDDPWDPSCYDNEIVATDTIFSDTPALDDGIPGHGGCLLKQFYCGCTSEFLAAFPMREETDICKSLQDFVRFYGAPCLLFVTMLVAFLLIRSRTFCDIILLACLGQNLINRTRIPLSDVSRTWKSTLICF